MNRKDSLPALGPSLLRALVRGGGVIGLLSLWLWKNYGEETEQATHRIVLASLAATGMSVGSWAASTEVRQRREIAQTLRIEEIAALVHEAALASAENEKHASARER